MNNPFNVASSVVLTSTTASQTTSVPTTTPQDDASVIVYNGAANPVYLKFAATVAIPAVGTWDTGLIVVQPGTTQIFGVTHAGGTLAYIAATAGGLLTVSVGEGI